MRRMSKTLRVVSLLGVVLLRIAAAPASASRYWIANSNTAPSAHCYQGLSHPDLLQSAPTGLAFTAFSRDAGLACSQPRSAPVPACGTPGTLEVWFTNANRKSCSVPWWVGHDAAPTHAPAAVFAGSGYDGAAYITVPAGTKTPLKQTVSFTTDAATLYAGDQITLWIDVRTRSGACSDMTLYYGSANTPTNVTL